MPSSLPQRIPLDAALGTFSNNQPFPPSTAPARWTSSSLSPTDCRTLKKILGDVRSPPPLVFPNCREHQKSTHSDDSANAKISGSDDESEGLYRDKRYGCDDEMKEAYEDDGYSMEMSNTVEADVEETNITYDRVITDDESIMSNNSDEREYVWSDGDTIEDIMNSPGSIASPAPQQDLTCLYQHDEPTPHETKEIMLHRTVIEKVVQDERLVQERRDAAAIKDQTIRLNATTISGQNDLISLCRNSDLQTIEAVHADIGLSVVEDDAEAAVELEYFGPFGRRTSQQFFSVSVSHRAIEDHLVSSSSATFLDTELAIPDTPFTKTVNYYKQHKGKENLPLKSRRNASLPEELAELAREARKEEEEEDDLDKYREVDLVPMEPVMESNAAGDLITFGTPVKVNILPMAISLDLIKSKAGRPWQSGASPTRLFLPTEENDNANADDEDSGAVLNPKEKQLILYLQHPTFVTVIGMLPEIMFWVTAAPVLKYSKKAYNALVERLAGLGL